MQWSDIPFRPPARTLRQFAALWIIFFGGVALRQWFVRGNPGVAAISGVLALTVGPIGLTRPEWLRPLYVSWMVLVFPIGWAVSQVVLTAMYYGLLTPIGLVFRLIGRDPLHRRRDPRLETYWSTKTAPADLGRYTQQF